MRFDICKVLILAAIIVVAGCGNLTEPSSFSFVTQTGVPLNTNIQSNVVTIKGNQFPASIAFTNASSAAYSQYSINGGAFTAGQTGDQLRPGDTLQLQQTSSSNISTARVTMVTVGGFTTTFTTVTGTSNGGGSVGDVAISNLTATLSQGKTAVNVTISATTKNTNALGNTESVALTLQAISNTGAVVAEFTDTSTTPAQILGGTTTSILFPTASSQSSTLPSTTSTLPAGLPAAIDGNPPSTVAYWNKTISYWRIKPGTLTLQ